MKRRSICALSLISILFLFVGCIVSKRPGPIENSRTEKVGTELEFDGLDLLFLSITVDREVEVEGTKYSSLLERDERWVILNFDVREPDNERTRMKWKEWFRIRTASGKILAPELAALPASAEIGPHSREWVSIFFKVRDSDFPLRLYDQAGKIDREVRR